jgi:hypothetical protein
VGSSLISAEPEETWGYLLVDGVTVPAPPAGVARVCLLRAHPGGATRGWAQSVIRRMPYGPGGS